MTDSYTPHDRERMVHEPGKTAWPGAADKGHRSEFSRDRARVLHSAAPGQAVLPGS